MNTTKLLGIVLAGFCVIVICIVIESLLNFTMPIFFFFFWGFFATSSARLFNAYPINNSLSFICFAGRVMILKDIYLMLKNKYYPK